MLMPKSPMTMLRSDVLFEARSTKIRMGLPAYFTFEQLEYQRGFQSQFGITHEQAAMNQIIGDTSGARYPVYCDTVLVDFDDCPDDARLFRNGLEKDFLAFVEADSGGRSKHFHIAIDPIFGVSVPSSVKQWVANRSAKADLSVYHTNGMFRLFGTKHEKTGRVKKPTHRQKGRRAEILLIDEPRFWGEPSDFEISNIEGAIAFVLSLLSGQPPVGNRYQTLWSCAKALKEALGDKPTTMPTIEGLLNAVNETWSQPKEVKEIHRLLKEISPR
jgi:hypothetical protein